MADRLPAVFPHRPVAQRLVSAGAARATGAEIIGSSGRGCDNLWPGQRLAGELVEMQMEALVQWD